MRVPLMFYREPGPRSRNPMPDPSPHRSFRWLFGAILGVAALEALLWLLRRGAAML